MVELFVFGTWDDAALLAGKVDTGGLPEAETFRHLRHSSLFDQEADVVEIDIARLSERGFKSDGAVVAITLKSAVADAHRAGTCDAGSGPYLARLQPCCRGDQFEGGAAGVFAVRDPIVERL